MNLERGFRRIAAVLSACGFMIGLTLLFSGSHVTDGQVVGLAFLTLWPWVAFYAVRWVARGFRSQ